MPAEGEASLTWMRKNEPRWRDRDARSLAQEATSVVMADDAPRIEYVEARRVLLDVLAALAPQLRAVVLVGAQAVYLRTEGRMAGYQPFTTDADVVLDPTLLGPIPSLGDAMRNAGLRPHR